MTEQNQKQVGKSISENSNSAEGFAPLLVGVLRQLIADSRQQVLRAVDTVQVQTYWHIGRRLAAPSPVTKATSSRRWATG